MTTQVGASNIIGHLSAELAAVTRLLEQRGVLNYSGHVSARIPGSDALLIQRGSDSRAALEPDRLLVVGLDGKVLEGRGKPPSEIGIHTEIMKARPDVGAVLHCHMDAAVAFTMMEGVTLLPMRSHAARWHGGIPVFADPSHIHRPEQARALAAALGPHNAVLMRAHGMVLVSESLPAALVDAVHFEENARAHLLAMQSGARPLPLTDADFDAISRTERRAHHCRKLWEYYVRKGIADRTIPAGWDLGIETD